jgi:hypothetical protein
MRAVIEQPRVAHDAHVEHPRRLVGDAHFELVPDRFAQRDRRCNLRDALLEAADVRDLRQALRERDADRIGRLGIEEDDADVEALADITVELEDRVVAARCDVGREHDHEVDADRLCVLGEPYDFVGILMVAAGDQRHAPARDFDVDLVHPHALFVGHRPELGHVTDAVMAFEPELRDAVLEIPRGRGLVQAILVREIGGQSRPHAFEHRARGFLRFRFAVFHLIALRLR